MNSRWRKPKAAELRKRREKRLEKYEPGTRLYAGGAILEVGPRGGLHEVDSTLRSPSSDNSEAHVVKTIRIDTGPGGTRDPVFHPEMLWKTKTRVHGNRFFLTFGANPASETWLTDKEADAWLKQAPQIDGKRKRDVW